VGDSTDQLMPVIAVNRAGAVGVTWYDRRNHPDNLGWDVRFTASVDGGVTFAPSVEVSPGASFGPTTPWTALRPVVNRAPSGLTLRVSLNSFMFLGGDTAGLVADALGVFHAVWVDNRTGIPQVFTAPIAVGPVGTRDRRRSAGSPARAASPPVSSTAGQANAGSTLSPSRAAAGADSSGGRGPELSDKVALVVTRVSYDRAGDVLTVTARLENRTSDRLAGPLYLRATAMRAELGDPVPTNADNGVGGPGAAWIFGASELAPNAATAERTMTFTLTNRRPFRAGRAYRLGVLELSAGIHWAP
jgi:hypothetical protein